MNLSWAATTVRCICCHNRNILLRYNDSLLLYIFDYIFHKVAFSLDAFFCCCCFLLHYIRLTSIIFVTKTPLVVSLQLKLFTLTLFLSALQGLWGTQVFSNKCGRLENWKNCTKFIFSVEHNMALTSVCCMIKTINTCREHQIKICTKVKHKCIDLPSLLEKIISKLKKNKPTYICRLSGN